MIKLMQGSEEINSNGGFPFVRKLPQVEKLNAPPEMFFNAFNLPKVMLCV